MTYVEKEIIICLYKHECTGYPYKCKSCRHNKGKRDYYEPLYPIYKRPREKWTWTVRSLKEYYKYGVIHDC